MIIISWDVGVIHLAYCVIKYDDNIWSILDWDVINLIENDIIQLLCCGETNKQKICGKKACYVLDNNGYCKTHLKQIDQKKIKNKVKKLFKTYSNTERCTHINTKGNKCDKKTHYRHDKNYYCNFHYRVNLAKLINEALPQQINNKIVRNFPTVQLQINLIKELDKRATKFSQLNIQEVIIENQPALRNPKMKSIANTIFDYFLIRAQIDKAFDFNIKLVRFICPSNKLKVNADNTLEVFKNNKDNRIKYKLTKQLGIQYTKQLIENDQKYCDHLNKYKKKDDLCDAFLQGLYYLMYIN